MNNTSPAPASSAGWLSPSDAAAYMSVSTQFLQALRTDGGGPKYVKLSAKMIRYERAALDAWLVERAHKSTFAVAS